MNHLAPELRMGVNVNCPSIDAARCLGDRLAAAEHDDRVKAQQMSAASAAEAAIKAIPHLDFSAEVAARLVVVLRNRVKAASWSHFEHVAEALEFLDDAHDALEAV